MSSNTLTDNDRKILAAAWHCFESQPKINYTKLASMMGYKTAASASACFNPVRKKLLASAGGAGGDGDGTPVPASASATPKKGGKGKAKGKGKRAAAAVEDEDDDEEVLQSKAKKAKAKASSEEGEGEGGEVGEVGVGVKSEGSDAE